MNAFTYEMTKSFGEAIESYPRHSLIITGAGEDFTVGGELVEPMKNPGIGVETVKHRIRFLTFLEENPRESLTIFQGITIGGGIAVLRSCSVRVATETTQFSFQENSIGFFVDAALTRYLARLEPDGLGLFLALTGYSMNGADCYAVGIATHFINTRDSQRLLGLTETLSLKEAADSVCCEPPEAMYKIRAYLPQIVRCFAGVNSVEEVLQRLSVDGSEWARRTSAQISDKCPLSLCLTLKALNASKTLTYRECQVKDFDRIMQLILHRNENFLTGVTHRLVNKLKTRPNWNPSHVSEVTEELMEKITANEEGPHLTLD
eukprot:CAMPEP_0204902652 /NCGR_PEP_ID=MMETSP1397-20131031/3800_1 /ASSEMBLY_ACC=CAM_ASM_000891 /TAXON_ID=49980 /ORGANISM="Climacostomum Climacostomum virens, Strain Stock W-24" /LENGTH=318 /DNA_ID=CAMNT_0052071189 /DNA_START=93 /DNA_END=1049 /DNA_ORIENTATION=-